MHKIFLFLFIITGTAYGQSADFILLKRKGKTVQTFFKGSHIEFVTTGGAYRDAQIRDIQNDSIFLQEFLVRRIPTTLGFIINDTAGSFSYAYHYKEIYRFGKENKKFNVNGSGAGLLGGSILLVVGSLVTLAVNKNKFSPGLLGAGIGLGTAGYFLSKSGSKGIVVGKKGYKLEYLEVKR